jgi:hypothetical protein
MLAPNKETLLSPVASLANIFSRFTGGKTKALSGLNYGAKQPTPLPLPKGVSAPANRSETSFPPDS